MGPARLVADGHAGVAPMMIIAFIEAAVAFWPAKR
jgi:hypothetical protein